MSTLSTELGSGFNGVKAHNPFYIGTLGTDY